MPNHNASRDATPVQVAARTAECLRIVRAPWITDDTTDLELGAKVAEQIRRFIAYDVPEVESGCIRVLREEDGVCSVYVLAGHIEPPDSSEGER